MTIILAAKTSKGVLMASDLAETVDISDSNGNIESVLNGYTDKIRSIGRSYAAGIAGTIDSPEKAFSVLRETGPEGFIESYPGISFIIASHDSLRYYLERIDQARHCGIGEGLYPEVIRLIMKDYREENALDVFRKAIKLSRDIGLENGMIIEGFLACRQEKDGFEILERYKPGRPVLQTDAYLYA